MERQLQKIDENYNTVATVAQKTLLKKNKHFLWKTGIQGVVTSSILTSLIITGFSVVPITLFSGSVIVGNILSICVEKTRKKNIKIFFQALNYTLDKINEKLDNRVAT